MAKTALVEHPINDLLKERWSPRAFDPRPVDRSVLESLFEAARWAASSNNEQPWRYIVGAKAEDPEQFDRLASVLVPQNGWAKAAPVLALSIAKTKFTNNGAPNRVALHDVGLATANLLVEATAQGVYVHQMAGFDTAKAREVFAIPEGYEPVAMMAIGYLGDPESLDETLKARELSERTRKRQEEFVFWGDFKA